MIAESFLFDIHTDTSFIRMSVYSALQDQYGVKTDFWVAYTRLSRESERC